MSKKSLFVVIEGLDGSGKSSVSRYLANLLDAEIHGKIKLTFEPHDPSCAGLFIRQVLMKKIRNFSPRILALAFAANRLDHCDREIDPWLNSNDGNLILCDRYYLSSLVYQSSDDFGFESVYQLNEKARKPDIIFFLNVSNKICQERMKIRNEAKELFEKNLSSTRTKFKDAISFLRDRGHEIVEVDASLKIEKVANQIVDKIYELFPDFIPAQPLLSRNLVQTPRVSTLNGHFPLTIESVIEKCAINDIVERELDREKSVQEIEKRIDEISFNELASLFLDHIRCLGIQVEEKLPWTELDAYELVYTMPGNILLRGVGLIIQEKQRYDIIIKKAPDIPKMSDFLFVFSPGPSELVTHYYERDKIVYNTENKKEGLFPSSQLVTQKDLAETIFERATSNNFSKLED